MSFQAYLDNIEEKTGKTPNDFIAEAKKKKLTESKDIIAWLKKDYGLGLWGMPEHWTMLSAKARTLRCVKPQALTGMLREP